jgi:NADH-quinone oxidoreductase subunit C
MTPSALLDLLTGRFRDAVSASHAYRGDATLVVRAAALFEIARFLRDDPDLKMDLLVDVTAVDGSTFGKRPGPAFFASSGVAVRPASQLPDAESWPGPVDGARFVVVDHFYSTSHKHRLRLTVPVPTPSDETTAPEVDSLTSLWPGANWLEREVWDMFGIRFRGHPDLKRILMYEEFQGHPLRKDYPVNRRQPLIGRAN